MLAEFDAHVLDLFGRAPSELRLEEMWHLAERTPGFFETMPKMPDADELWSFCAPFEPTIITGLPRGRWAAPQKRAWVRTHLGADIPVITCMAREKSDHASPGDVLVDDNTRFAHLWRQRGGIFVHHSSAARSIEVLRRLGFGAESRP